MVVNAKCNPCKEPTKYVAGFFDGPRGRRGCLFDCKNEQCEIYQVKRFTESEAVKERVRSGNIPEMRKISEKEGRWRAMLTLPIKKKWFDMIVSGEKKEEYREIKPYYDSRFMNAFGFLLVGGQMVYGEAAPEEIRKPWPVLVVFRNGYSKDSPEVVCKCTLQFGKGKPEWGAEPGKLYYVLKIEKVEEVRNHVLLG